MLEFIFLFFVVYFIIRRAIDGSETADNIREIRKILESNSANENIEIDISTKTAVNDTKSFSQYKCPSCLNIISSKDKKCPHCGMILIKELS